MRLAGLSAAERAFLCGNAPDAWIATLAARLQAVLAARMRCAVRVAPAVAAPLMDSATAIRWDAALSALWVAHRLGGAPVTGSSALDRSLMRTLEPAVAAWWRGARERPDGAREAAFVVTTALGQGTLAVRLPDALPLARRVRSVTGRAA
jgi:hypothetical protein